LSAVGAQFTAGGGKVAVAPAGNSSGNTIDPVQYLLAHGCAQVTSYQPDGRYWTLQWIEFGWLTALAIVLPGATFWLLRRTPA
jgi:hypothetical protein